MATTSKQLVSKLATYKNGQLMCIVCNVPVKNEMYWTGHVKGKVHLTNVMQLKRKAESASPDDSTAGSPAKKVRTETPQQLPSSSVHSKSILKNTQTPTHVFAVPKTPRAANDFTKTPSHANKHESNTEEPAPVTNGALFNRLEAEYDDQDEEMETDITPSTPVAGTSSAPTPSDNERISKKKADLPEGFFDDPKEDAKVRGIEFVDPEEAEWSRFLKEIASEEMQSESIQVVDEEESRKDRELEEVEEMMTHWQKVIDLEKMKDNRVKKMVAKDESSESSEDEEVNDDLDWRVKKVKQTR